MRAKRKTKLPSAREKDWEEAAKRFEAPGIDALLGSTVLTKEEAEEMLRCARGEKKKLISIRMPETSLRALKELAVQHDRKYQQLIVQAVDQFIVKAQKVTGARKR